MRALARGRTSIRPARTSSDGCSRRRWTSRFPDATLPATNDCWYHIGLTGEVGHGIPNADGFYEMAFGWFRRSDVRLGRRGEPPSATACAPRWRRCSTARSTSPPSSAARRRRQFADSGLAMLRGGCGADGDRSASESVASDDGDSHGHPDQLGHRVLRRRRRALRSIPGRPATASRSTTRGIASRPPIRPCCSTARRSRRPRSVHARSRRRRIVAEAEIAWPSAENGRPWSDRARRDPVAAGAVDRLCGRPGPHAGSSATGGAAGHESTVEAPDRAHDRLAPARSRAELDRRRNVDAERRSRARLRLRTPHGRRIVDGGGDCRRHPGGELRVRSVRTHPADEARYRRVGPGQSRR